MRKKIRKKRILACLMAAAVWMNGISVQPMTASAKEVKEAAGHRVESYKTVEGVGRKQIIFNKGWKFIRSDVEGAEKKEFDDSAWVDVAIPHNFSIPYEMSPQFYVGYGWYRKEFEVPKEWDEKKIELEFEGVFQEAEVYVNGVLAGKHRGGYSGFVYDITEYLTEGNNEIAVRVNNIWQADLAPRGGDHHFTGGIYRDVYLNVTEDVHVTWYGTFVTTPDLTNPAFDSNAKEIDFASYLSEEEIQKNIDNRESNVRVQTEVKNDSEEEKQVQVKQTVKDQEGETVAEFASERKTLQPGEVYNFDSVSEKNSDLELWSPENPYVYQVETEIISDGIQVDTYESPLGFRWVQWKNDGLYLNGKKTLINGANCHQDHAGFADAVTDAGLYRDVAMIKECGMNFIRGSHYPHDPSYAAACDELGIMFWSECNFWGAGGSGGKESATPSMTASDWTQDPYPQKEENEAEFEKSCLDSLEAMIRVNRNHPSIVNWSMGNEVFFTSGKTQQKAKNLVDKMRNLSHKLDPTRKAGMGGVQRAGYDSLEICDIAGYNGDGGSLFECTWMPSVVAEYGSKTLNRPGEYRPFYDAIQNGEDIYSYKLKGGSAGLVLWCAFHHGSVGGSWLAEMGMIDYYRLPLKSWYWYRNQYNPEHPEPEFSVSGTAASMEITASDLEITNDGKKDTRLTIIMKDSDGRWVNDNRKVTLSVVEGPGIFPGGKTFKFEPNKSMRDGKAAIEFRSYYAGTTVIRAEAEGLPSAEITIETKDALVECVEDTTEPDHFFDAGMWSAQTKVIEEPKQYGDTNQAMNRPTKVSSGDESASLAMDGNLKTAWMAEKEGNEEYYGVFLEWPQYIYKMKLGFEKAVYPYEIQVKNERDEWETVASYTRETVEDRPVEESFDGVYANEIKILFPDVPEGKKAYLSELEVYGNNQATTCQYRQDSVYLSDVIDMNNVTNGWESPGKDLSVEGNPIRVGGKTYKKGLGLHANSSVTYNVNGAYSRVTGVAGIDNEVTNGNAWFEIYADNELIYSRELAGSDSDAFNLSIHGVQTLRFVTEANGSASEDHTDWADVKLLGAIRNISLEGSDLSVQYVGMSQVLKPSEDYLGMLRLENKGEKEQTAEAQFILYDEDGKELVSDRKSVVLPRKSGKDIDLICELPEDLYGCVGEMVVLGEDGEPITKKVPINALEDIGGDQDNEKIEWSKLDGEDSSIAKEGNWSIWNSSQAYEGTETCGNAGDKLTYTFSGSYVKIGAKVDRSQVGAKVSIDGQEAETFSTTEDHDAYKEVWTSEKLEDGEHIIVIEAVGKFGLDYIETGKVTEFNLYPEEKEQLKDLYWNCLLMKTEDLYTEESRKILSDVLKKAKRVIRNGSAELEEIEQVYRELSDAYENLTYAVQKQGLSEAIAKAEALLKESDSFTEESVRRLEADLKEAQEMVMNEMATQEQVDQSKEKLLLSMAKLEPKESETETEEMPAQSHPITPPDHGYVGNGLDKPSIPVLPSPSKTLPKVKSTYEKNGILYEVRVSKAADKQVSVKKILKKTVRKVTIPKKITIHGYSYLVTAIKASAMKNCRKLGLVIIGKNVATIGRNIFVGCHKLKTIQIKSEKLKKVDRRAFKGIGKQTVIKVPKKYLKKYKKLLAKKGQKKGVRIVRK